MTTTWVPLGPSCLPDGAIATANAGTFRAFGHGVVSGRISAIALSSDGATIYAGASSGGVWKSTDEGASWRPTMDDQPTLAVGAIAVAGDTIYVGTGEANGSGNGVMPGVGILFSEDAGASWQVFPPQGGAGGDLVGAQIGRIVVHPDDPKQLYAATSKGLLVTTDRARWVLLLKSTGDGISDVAVDFADPARPRVYAAAQGDGIYVADGVPASDADLTSSVLPVQSLGRIALALGRVPGGRSTLYAAFEEGESTNSRLQAVLRSVVPAPADSDRSDHWTEAPDWQRLKGGRQLEYNFLLAVDPRDPERVFFGETKLYRRTRDKTWHVVSQRSGLFGLGSYQGVHDDQHALAFHPTRPDTIWLGNDGGMWVSTDGGETFHARNRGLHTFQLYSVSQHPRASDLLFAGTQDNGGIRYTGHPAWRTVTGGDAFYTAIHQAMPNVWYATPTYDQGRVSRSLLFGAADSFSEQPDGLTGFTERAYAVVVTDPTEPTTAFVGIGRLYWSHGATGHGQRWEAIDASNDGETGAITAIALAPGDSTVLYYARSRWFDGSPVPGSVHRLDRTGTRWTHTASSAPVAGDLQQILVDPDDPDQFHAVIGGWDGPGFSRVFATNDRVLHGKRNADHLAVAALGWLHAVPPATVGGRPSPGERAIGPIRIPNDAISVNAIARAPGAALLFVGTDYGVYCSLDAGVSWQPFGTGLPQAAVVTSMVLHPQSHRLRVSTLGRGVWECALDEPDRACDLHVRDCLFDDGRGTTPVTASNPGGLGELHWTDAPDLKLDTESPILGDFDVPSSVHYDGARLDYLGFEALGGDAPRARSTSRVYVQVHNRGPAAIPEVQVRVFLATKGSGGYPALPGEFWTKFTTDEVDTAHWKPLGPVQVLHELRAAEPQVARFDWTFHGAGDTVGLLAVVTSVDDPVPVLSLDAGDAARGDKHVLLKEHDVHSSVLQIVVEVLAIAGLIGGGIFLATRE